MEIVAHRGANWHFPENTLNAFRRALQDGATVLEMDVHRTQDDRVLVCHNPIWRGKRISKNPYEVFELDLPKLEDVLVAFPNAILNIDIKTRDLKATYLTVDLLRKLNSSNRVCLTSFHWEVHRWLRDLKYEGERGLSTFEIVGLFLLPEILIQMLAWQGRRAQVPIRYGLFKFASSYFVKKCHRLGLFVDYWVINQLEEARKLEKLGADRVMTDDPATLMPLGSV